jgi:hypothetical protein
MSPVTGLSLWDTTQRMCRAVFAQQTKTKISVRQFPYRALLLLGIQALLVAVVTGVAFWLGRQDLISYIDGHYLLTLLRNRADFSAGGLELSINPLQGLGELWFFANTPWMPEFLPARVFSNPDYQRVGVHVAAAVELFVAVAAMAFWLERSAAKAVAAGWLAVILISPITYPSLLFNISADAPELISMILIPLLIIPVWAGIGRGSPVADACRAAIIAAMIWLHFVVVGIYTVLAYPFLAVFSIVFLAASWPNKTEFFRKLGWGAVLLIFLAASGLFEFVLYTTIDAAYFFFPDELKRARHNLEDGSLLFRTGEPLGILMTALAVIGALVCVRAGRDDTRRFALATFILAGSILSLSVVWRFANWSGPIPIYFEYTLWAVYPIFVVFLVAPIARLFWPYLSPHASFLSPWPLLLLPLLAVLVFHGSNAALRRAHNDRPNIYPPASTALTEYLRDKVAIAVGSPFRGRVATMTGQARPNITWEEMFTLDMDLIRAVGNEHRNIGLWYYNVPTIFAFSHTVSPMLYALVKRYLACEGDPQFRTLLHLRCPNVKILRLMGVRYILADDARPADNTERVSEMRLPANKGSLAIDEISRPNLGLSPTEIVHLAPGSNPLDWLGRPDSNLERQAVLAGSDPGPLVPASNMVVTIERDGIGVRAESLGRSLLIVPFEYSHCWVAAPRNGTQAPELRRADFLLMGILFERKLDTAIHYKLAPFRDQDCRRKDFNDHALMLRP